MRKNKASNWITTAICELSSKSLEKIFLASILMFNLARDVKIIKIQNGMKRIMPDTNIYGLIARDFDRIELVDKIIDGKIVLAYGNKIIRNELRDIPKKIKFDGKSVRVDILNLYDKIVKGRNLKVNESVIETADNYYKAYMEFGGSKSRDGIIADLMIVACASFYEMDILVSSDEKSMLTENAIKAYKLVNSITKKRTPKFIDFNDFKKYLRGGKSNEFV